MPRLAALLLLAAVAVSSAPTALQIDFLRRYGYLDEGPPDFRPQYSEATVAAAVRRAQAFAGLPVTGAFDARTAALLRRKRCGNRDVEARVRRHATVGPGWGRDLLTFEVSKGSARLDAAAVDRHLRRALDAWSEGSRLRFRPADDGRADLRIAFGTGAHGDRYAFDGPGGVLGHAFFPHAPDGGGVHLDDDEEWADESDPERGTTGLLSPLLHELGHALGLGHSDEPEAVMFPYLSDVGPSRPHGDDLRGLAELYGDDDGVCRGVDALTVRGDELLAFRGDRVWIFGAGSGPRGRAVPLGSAFPNLPASVRRVDAACRLPDGSVALFSGSGYYVCGERGSVRGPLPLTDLGLPEGARASAALFWGRIGRLYVFEGDRLWRYRYVNGTPLTDDGYPKAASRWRGIPAGVDGAFDWKDGHTYFFKGVLFWKFDRELGRAAANYPLPGPQIWFGCPETEDLAEAVAGAERTTG